MFHVNIPDIIGLIGSTYAVPLFFLISGFCIHLSQLKQIDKSNSNKLHLLQYFTRRFWRIYPSYLIIFLFACSVHAINGERVGVKDFFVHLFVLQGLTVKYFNSINLVLWTITIEILFYLIYPLWYNLRNRLNHHWALLISLLVSIISWAIILLKFNADILPLRFLILNIWVGWCFGAWLCEELVFNKRILHKNLYWWMGGATLFLLNYFLGNVGWFRFASYNISIVLWGWLIVPLFLLEPVIEVLQSKWLSRIFIGLLISIGASSYSLYMLHEPLMFLRNAILANITSPNVRALLGVVWLMVTFIIAFFSYQLFEQPFLKYRKV